MDLGLKGKKAIVTGSTKGIGRRIVNLLADEGVDVAVCSRTAVDVEAAVAALGAKGVKAIGDAVDVKDKEAYISWINSSAEQLGGLDIFVPNVSGVGGGGDEEDWRNLFEVDILGAVRGCETAQPHLKKSDAGAIVLISSVSALEASAIPELRAYGSFKAALISYGAQLSQALAPEGIRVNTVSPGPIEFEGGFWDYARTNMTELYQSVLDDMPIGRMGSPEEVANAVVFLSSPVASLITGSNLVVDGGCTKHVDY